MLREPLGVVAREEWVARDQLAKAIREEHIVGIRKVVVEVRASPETDRVVPLIEGRVGVLEIELVLTDLRGGVQHLALRAADTRRDEPLADPEQRRRVEHEAADVLFFLVRLAQRYGIDLTAAFEAKLALNAERYPVEKARGSNRKYTEL